MLFVDAVYGLVVVVVHALLLGEADKRRENGERGWREERDGYQTASTNYQTSSVAASPSETGWWLQLMDVDVSWGHQLVGFEDYSCLLAGLLYGLAVVMFTVCGAHSVIMHREAFSSRIGRWLVLFMHVQLLLYAGVCLAKYPHLCEMRRIHFPSLEASCEVLQFAFAERVAVRLCACSVCIWVFGSFVHLASGGADEPAKFWDESDEERPRVTRGALRISPVGMPQVPGQFVSGSFPMAHSHSQGIPVVASVGPRRYAGLGGGVGTTLPRAHSSQATTVSHASDAAETTALIRGPVAVH